MGLPQLIDPMVCLEQQRVFEGVINSNQLPRLSLQLSKSGLMIPYKITFSQDHSRRCIVHCSITTYLHVVCQRCGESMELPISLASQLCVVAHDQMADDLPKYYEPLVTVEGMISLVDVVEEELLLAIPMIPRHDMMECPVNLSNDLLN